MMKKIILSGALKRPAFICHNQTSHLSLLWKLYVSLVHKAQAIIGITVRQLAMHISRFKLSGTLIILCYLVFAIQQTTL